MTTRKARLRIPAWISLLTVLGLMIAAGASRQAGAQQGSGQAVVTVLPKHDAEMAPSVSNQDLAVKVNGKTAKVTEWSPLNGASNRMELVLLIDDSARSSLGTQLSEIEAFVKTLPPNTRTGIAYMENGRAAFTGPLSTDHDQVLKALHLPAGGAGVDSSPYFCLSDLAKNWPSTHSQARREVIMVTDGLDRYQPHYDPEDPYVQAAMNDAVRAHLVVYSIYWLGRGRIDSTEAANTAGQNLLVEVTQATGGKSFWQGFGNPVSLQPYFEELTRRFRNQYELGFESPLNGKPEVESFKLKLSAPGGEVTAPQQVFVTPAGTAHQ
ncbi:MAG: hypothetical protein ABSF53_08800 [Terracidiphilus sp.]